MMKTNLALAMGIATLSCLFAPAANAGCGRELGYSLPVFSPAIRAAEPVTQFAADAEAANPGHGGAIVGLWSTTVSLQGVPVFQAFESFTSDGLEFLNDNGSTLEGNVCFGTWTTVPHNTIKIYHPSWNYDASGNLIGTVVIKSTIVLGPGGNTFSGSVTVDTYDINGKVSAPELQADLSGKRITAD